MSDKQLRDQSATTVSQVDKMNNLRERFREYTERFADQALPIDESGLQMYRGPMPSEPMQPEGVALITYVPQEYPKMVPGPNGPTIVQDGEEEYKVLTARIETMGPKARSEDERMEIGILLPESGVAEEPDYSKHMLGDPEWCPKTPTGDQVMRDLNATNEKAMAAQFEPNQLFDVDAWCKARSTLSHDWIGALYRPYEPTV